MGFRVEGSEFRASCSPSSSFVYLAVVRFFFGGGGGAGSCPKNGILCES